MPDTYRNSIDFLLQCARLAPSADNSQPWEFHIVDDGFLIGYALSRVGGTTFPESAQATLLAIGAVVENIRQGAVAANISIEIKLFPPLAKSYPTRIYASIHLVEVPTHTAMPLVSDLALSRRHTNRNAYTAAPVPDNEVEPLCDSTVGHAYVRCIRGEDIGKVADILERASQIRFQTRETHEWLAKSLRYTEAEVDRGSGLDVRTLNLPPGGGLLLRLMGEWSRMKTLNRIRLYKPLSLIEAGPVRHAPMLMAIVAGNSDEDLLQSGTLSQKVWITLNALGLSVHPYYVIADQLDRLRQGTVPQDLVSAGQVMARETQEILGYEAGEGLKMLFRVGYSRKDAYRSRRLASNQLIAAQ